MTSRFYSNINLAEQFNPLVRLDIELKNSFKILTEIRRDRSLSLSLDNSLLTEQTGNEYIFGLGYRLKDLRIRTKLGGSRVALGGDLNLKADFSYRKNITLLRNLEYDNNQVTAGQTLMSIKFSAGYNLSKINKLIVLRSQFFRVCYIDCFSSNINSLRNNHSL